MYSLQLSLENSTESMGNQIEELHTINEKLQENFRSTNVK
jgi:prefoldin subunit 5